MKTRKIKIGVMGCANIALRSVIPAIKAMPEFELIAVSSRNINKARHFSDIFDCEGVEGYDNLLENVNIDAIYLPLPTGIHEEWVIKSLNAGKHLLVEKSVAEDLKSAERMINLANRSNLLLMENLMFQYHSQHSFVKDLINQDMIGDIRLFRSSFGFPPLDSGNIRYIKELGGGALLDAGCYPLKASQMFLDESLSVKASHLFIDKVKGVNVYGSAYLSNSKGSIAEIAFGFDNFYQCNYVIWGSKGKISVERAFTPTPDMKPKIILEKDGNKEEYFMDKDNHFINSLKEFHRSICSGDLEHHHKAILTQAELLGDIWSKSEKNYK